MGAQIRMMIHVQYGKKSFQRWMASRATRRLMAVRIRMTAHVQADLYEWFGLTQLLKSVVVAVEHLIH
jgi:hypothetical protein